MAAKNSFLLIEFILVYIFQIQGMIVGHHSTGYQFPKVRAWYIPSIFVLTEMCL